MNNLFTFNSLNNNEVAVIARLSFERKKIVSNKEIKKYILQNCKDKNRFIYNLIRNNILLHIKKGYYTFNFLEFLPRGIRVANYLIPSIYFPNKDYYIGYSSALN